MPMRQDCKQFESRTYPNGETVRKCNLDLAPEAPWRCPEDCPKYERRLVDVNWSHGTLVTPATPDEPAELDLDAYAPADDSPVSGGIPAAIDAALATVPVRGVTIVTVNGRMVHLDVAAPGVDVVTDPEDALGIAMSEPTDVFAEMNDDFTMA